MRLQDFESGIATAGTTEELWDGAARVFQRTPTSSGWSTCTCRRSARPTAQPDIRAEGFPEALRAAVHGAADVPRQSGPRAGAAAGRAVYWDEIDEADVEPARARLPRGGARHGASATASAFRSTGRTGGAGSAASASGTGVRRLDAAGAARVLAGLRARASAVLRAGAADARAAGAVAAGDRGAGLGGARQEQRADRRDPRHLRRHGRCAPAADLPQARGLRPDQRRGARHRHRADPRGA